MSNADEPVVVVAFIPAKEGQLDALVDAFTGVSAAVHQEEGCLLYSAHRSDDSLVVIEKWANAAAIDAHGKGDAMKALGSAIGPYVGGRPAIHRLAAVPAGDATKGSL
ncbi:MAG: putative quinol monooxygenase [Mycobacteriales bacterium]